MLEWLQGQLPVPRVVSFREERERVFLLVTGIPGTDAARSPLKPEEKTLLVAQGLKLFHSIPVDSCPFDQGVREKLRGASFRVKEGLVDEEEFYRWNPDTTPMELLDRLYDSKPLHEDLVVTHGDYCLPNILLNNSTISGFVDLSRCGAGDRMQDIGLCLRSLEYNFRTREYNSLFLETYGLALSSEDEKKIQWFTQLDELS